MAQRHRTVLRQEVAFAAGDAPIIDDLPVNPLSYIDITLRGTTLAFPTIPTLANILAVLTNIEVLFKGSAIVSIDPDDLYVLQAVMGWVTSVPQPLGLNTGVIFRLLLTVSLSRRLHWLNEGFPASRRGELQLRLTPAATFTNVGTLSLNVETEEILDAQFRQFLKYTTISKTPSATGDHDTDLPIGNPLAGVLAFGTTVPTSTTVTASIRQLKLLIDNQEVVIPSTRWDTLHAHLMRRIPGALWTHEHTHLENLAAVYTQNVASGRPQWDDHAFNNHAYLDFDPLMDAAYWIQTAGRSRVHTRITADVADAIRLIPVEVLELAAARAPAP